MRLLFIIIGFQSFTVFSNPQIYPLQERSDLLSVIEDYNNQLDSLRILKRQEQMAIINLGLAEAYYDLALIEQFRQATDSAVDCLTQIENPPFKLLQRTEVNKARYANFYIRPNEAMDILLKVEQLSSQQCAELPYIYYETIATTHRNLTDDHADILYRFNRAEKQLTQLKDKGTIYKARLYRSIGNSYLDRVKENSVDNLNGAIHYYKKALKLLEANHLEYHPIRLQLYTLMGLAFYTAEFYKDSEQAYAFFFKVYDKLQDSGYDANNALASYLNAINWASWNSLRYDVNIEDSEVKSQLNRLKTAMKKFTLFSNANRNPTLQLFLNTYHYSPHSSISALFAKRFEITGDERFIDSLLFYSEKSKANLYNYTFDAKAFVSLKNQILQERSILHFGDANFGERQTLVVTFISDSIQMTKTYYDVGWIKNIDREISELSIDEYKSLTNRIYRQFIRPNEPYLSQGKPIAVIPTMDLQRFSFEALVVDTTKPFYENPFLWNSYSITQHPTIFSLAKQESRKFDQSISIIAPNYNKRELSDLRFTQNLFKTRFKNSKIYSSDLTGIESSVLLISAHATSREETGGLSFISFEDRDIEISELDSANVQTNFAVLVMCNASNGKRINSSGFYSITSAFMRYGANSCIGSLWSIDDFTTAQILELFFDNLSNGLPKDLALEKAKKTFLMNSETREFYHPMYWAGLHAVGDLSPIKIIQEPAFTNHHIGIISGIIFLSLSLIILWLARHIRHWRRRQLGSRVK